MPRGADHTLAKDETALYEEPIIVAVTVPSDATTTLTSNCVPLNGVCSLTDTTFLPDALPVKKTSCIVNDDGTIGSENTAVNFCR
jgi:hypothetical protein